MAVGILSSNPREYAARAFSVSGTCKRESVEDQQSLIQDGIDVFATPDVERSTNLRIYTVATDGDSRRRRALAPIVLAHDLPKGSPLHVYLGSLALFNKKCGYDEINGDCDYKHEWKRLVGPLIRPKGVVVMGVEITSLTLEHHLTHKDKNDGETSHQPLSSFVANSLLRPNDRQDVLLAFRLIDAISKLPPAPPSSNPSFRTTRHSICLLGKLFFYLVQPYIDVSLSLEAQLTHISTAGHLLLAMYSEAKGALMSSQLYYDIITTHKAAFFTVAKIKVDNPQGTFFLGHMGSDREESVFGVVRTSVGSSSNVDQYQLTHRLTGAVQCNLILAEHPEWDRSPRRL